MSSGARFFALRAHSQTDLNERADRLESAGLANDSDRLYRSDSPRVILDLLHATIRVQMLEVSHVSVQIGRREILTDVSYTARCGEIVALLGANGAGKSTLLRTIAGEKIGTSRSGTVRGASSVAYCPDSSLAFRDLSVEENLELLAVAMGLRAEERGQRRRILTELISNDAPRGKPVDTLSLGQRRRLDIALTVCKDAQIYLFDEPFNGLDALWLQLFLDLVRELADSGRICLIASHAAELLLPIATAVWQIEEGRVSGESHGPAGSLSVEQSALREARGSRMLPWIGAQDG